MRATQFTAGADYPSPDFGSMLSDPELVRLLNRRWREAILCYNAGATLATVILLGSLLEGFFLAKAQENVLTANGAASAPKFSDTGDAKPFREWTLTNFINVAYECGWIKKQHKNFSLVVRDYRNFVHPNVELHNRTEEIDVSTCRVIWEAVSGALGCESPVSNLTPPETDFALAQATQPGRIKVHLSEKAVDLLLAAAADERKVIFKTFRQGGPFLEIGEKLFGGGEPRQVAEWDEALEELEEHDLIKDASGTGEWFDLRSRGHNAAEQLKKERDLLPTEAM